MIIKARKKLIAILCILVVVFPISIGVLAKITNSAKDTTQTFGIEMLHESETLDKKNKKQFGYATDTSTKPTYRIYAGDASNKDYDTTILCLDQSKRYPQEAAEKSNAEYTSLGEATTETLKEAQSGLTDEDTEKIKWLIKNAVAPEDSDEMKDLKLAKILDKDLSGNETNKLTLDQVKSVLTDDDLVFAMQFAIWEVTNKIKVGAPQGTEDGKTWAALAGPHFGYKGKYILKIIEFYTQQLQKSSRSDIIDDQSEKESNLQIINGDGSSLEDGKAGVKQEKGYVYIGPFKITGSEGNDYTVKISLLDENDKDANTNFFIREEANDTSKKLSSTKKDLDEKNFYIQVRGSSKAKKVKIELQTGLSIQTAKGYVWTREKEDQPLISLEREERKGKKVEKEFTFDITHEKEYDVALRKYISSIKRPYNGNQWKIIWQETENGPRKPNDLKSEKKLSGTDAFNQYEYKHKKEPLEVRVGDRITYTIQVTNEEQANIEVTKVKDYLPPKGLKFVQDDQATTSMKWTYDDKTATTTYFENFSPNNELDSRWVKIVCEVTEDGVGKVLTNIAEIEEFKDKSTKEIITQDIDSGPGNIELPKTDEEWENYKGNEDNKDDLSDPEYYYKGQQDDDDFDKVIVKAEESKYTIQIKKVDTDHENKGLKDAEFSVTLPSKETTTIKTEIGGFATTPEIPIKDTEKESITIKETKAPEGYKLIDETFIIDVEKEIKDGKYVLKSVELREKSGYADLQADIQGNKIILTVKNKQDSFDLRLRKYITKIDDTEVKDRIPVVKLNGDVLEYVHDKNAKLVKKGQKVEYTIRVYNEGVNDGYAEEIKDDIPDGLKFLPQEQTNQTYGWEMYKEDGTTKTENVEEAKIIKTKYLSKEKCTERKEDALKAFNPPNGVSEGNPAHKEVKVVFEVTKEVTSEDENREIVNTAEITDDKDSEGNDVTDVDSTPGNGVANEDDIDNEYLKLELENSNYKVQVEKVDEKDSTKKLKDAKFTVTLPGGETQEITTGDDGTATTKDIEVKNKDNDTITIKEKEAPEGYRLVDETFKIIVTKNIENDHYVFDSATLEGQSNVAVLEVNKEEKILKIIIKNKQDAFDLRLRKFISKVENETTDGREPVVSREGNEFKYEHSKVPKVVKSDQKVEYTIRVYNEGKIAGYASEIKDDIPEGLTFLPQDPINEQYGWQMYDSDGNPTEDPTIAKTIKTDYLSKANSDERDEQALKPFDQSKGVDGTNPDHRDVKVVFQVTAKASSDKQVIINTAEISDDQDGNGDQVDDVDSTPNNNNEDEDDIDQEYIQLETEESEYNLKIEKVDEDDENIKLKNAEFSVTLPSEETKTVTTGEDGIAEIPTIKVTNAETEIIKIKETKAPAGYRLIKETFEIELTKEIKDGQYVITSAILTSGTEIAKLTTDGSSLKITIKNKKSAFDLRLRKFITEVEGTAKDRAPKVTYENGVLKYEHSKVPVTVKKGQKVVYTIRVYNEGVADGYAAEIKDDIPEGLTFLPSDETNVKYGWKMYDGNGQETANPSDAVTIRTDYLSKEKSEERNENNLLKAFNSSENISDKNPDNREVKVAFQVSENASTDVQIVNTAEISKDEDINGNDIEDDDSEPDNNDPNEDDIDKEYLKVEIEESEFKLKIEKVDESDPNKKLADAEFTVTLSDGKTQNVITGSDGIGELPTIKVTNTDTETIKIKETKAPKGYELIGETFEIELTKGVSNGHYVVTNATLTNDSDIATLSTEENTLKITIKNKPSKFDLALRKYITQLGGKEISDREPKVTYENGEIKYNHSKDPLTVVQGQKIIYTIRVYNEGNQDGYAAEITDDIPDGLTFLPDDSTNKTYGWKMYDSSGNETKDVKKAVSIKTDYLSKEKSESNLLRAFNSEAGISDTNPDHKDVKVAFEVNTDSMSSKNKTIINTAEITKDEDEGGNDIDDIDSTPGNNEPDEDDIDKEYVEPKYFDLSLLKYVSKVIVTEDGVTKETETGYDGTENPEPIVKVELDRKKLNKTEVKYVFTIKITNEGEIEGYATEITDRIPEGLEFHEEDNKQYGWKIKEKGIVTTDYLKNKLLKPGESATVQIVLRWINSDKNLKQKTNVAEITADDNPYDAPDIDSTPNNNKDGEDDQDDAAVILSISTGKAASYAILVVWLVTFTGLGAFAIKKIIL